MVRAVTPSSKSRRRSTAARSVSPSWGCPQHALVHVSGHVRLLLARRVSSTRPSASTT